MRRSRGWVAASAAVALVAACHKPARVTLVPVGGPCAQPASGKTLLITAYTASGEQIESIPLDKTVVIRDFPADTEQIGVEVVDDSGVIAAAGKSAPLDFALLSDEAKIPVLMGPLDGFCAVGAMTEPRQQPLVARAGDGVLVVGGFMPSGAQLPPVQLSTAEYFDPATATFSAVAVPSGLDTGGFPGASLATLPDGRVVLTGGPNHAFVVFDPVARAFVTQPVVVETRSFHASIALGPDALLTAGGCTTTGASCEANDVPRKQMERYQLDDVVVKLPPKPVVQLPTADPLRVGAQLFDLGVQLDGAERYLLAGGTEVMGAAGAAERFAIDDIQATPLPGGLGQAAMLDGGAVLTAFAADGEAANNAVAVYAPDGLAAQLMMPAQAAVTGAGMRLIGLEDGRVVGFGGGTGDVVSYDPTRDSWLVNDSPVGMPAVGVPAPPGMLISPSLARLADGSVLVLGGAFSADAWLYRPSLIGPSSGSVTAMPASDEPSAVLTAPDQGTVARVGTWMLSTANGQMARALVGGPRIATGSVSARLHVLAGGVGLIAQQMAPGQAIVGELVPGQPARLVQLAGGEQQVLCSGSRVSGFVIGAPVVVVLTISATSARLTIAGADVLACSIALADRGAWGIASLGAGASVTVDSVTVSR